MKNLVKLGLPFLALSVGAVSWVGCQSEYEQPTERAQIVADNNSPNKIIIEVERPARPETPVGDQMDEPVDTLDALMIEMGPGDVGPDASAELAIDYPISPARAPLAYAQSPFFNDGSVPPYLAHLIGKYGELPSRVGFPPFLYSPDR
ncbi:MAG TPA: hypothetical protein VEL47_06360 [Myxococcota bacterium]|nr:hypothetical protein [Myxococcota bacterium]